MFIEICSRNEFVVFCLKNREMCVKRVNLEPKTTITCLHSIALPQEFDMKSLRLDFVYDYTNLLVSNASGTILSYNWNIVNASKCETSIYVPCPIKHDFVKGEIDKDCLSLEQQKQFEDEKDRKMQVQRRKAEVLEIIAKLKNEFVAIKDQSSKLPEKCQLNAAAFEIDDRITDDLQQKTQHKFQVIEGELRKKINKIKNQAERLEHLYTGNLEHWPITVTGFR